ncbi:MAG: spore maturation protein [Peptococcaceae bacterium BICA1-7]|nr:MAG: spore maturation protein [Peptococcaceae bacterium BICA1-7]HBV96914.1 spore maturation protein [Desulfotomaculum sp.]
MVNVIWLGMIVFGILAAAAGGNIEVVTKAALEGAGSAVKISIGLIAIITFWLGIMKLAEEAGIISFLSRAIAPLMKFLFPEIPGNHPAMGAIIMNISANVLGLGNAATPMGLIAMQEMQKLNSGDPRTASNSMCTFLALNTSCITIIPTTIIGIRVVHGSADPTEVVGTTIFATACGMTVAVIADRLFRSIFTRHRGRS